MSAISIVFPRCRLRFRRDLPGTSQYRTQVAPRLSLWFGGKLHAFQVNTLQIAAVPSPPLPPRGLDEDSSHGFRRGGEEMPSAFPGLSHAVG